jgi:hypothetical protein
MAAGLTARLALGQASIRRFIRHIFRPGGEFARKSDSSRRYEAARRETLPKTGRDMNESSRAGPLLEIRGKG